MITANRSAAPQVFVKMEVEMAVHVDGADRNGALIIKGIVAASTQGQVSSGRVDVAHKNRISRKRDACIARQAEVSKRTAVARVIDGVDRSIGPGDI